ncbi:MAG TPA: NnrS family protein, partial [Acetobacteraceae bacterium]
AVPLPAAIHALTAGAIATMTLAVMTRATLGHTGRALTASRATVVIYTLVTLAALTRIAAAWATTAFMPLLVWSAFCWIAAFGLFSIVYGRMLVTRRQQARAA